MSDSLSAIGMSFGEAADIYLQRTRADLRLKPRAKARRRERLKAIRDSWEEIDDLDVRRIRPSQCQQWAARFRKEHAPKVFNETLETLNAIFNLAVGLGLHMKNPAAGIKPMAVKEPSSDPVPPKGKLPKRVKIRIKSD
ncbi:MAG: hypothetical protein CMO74_10700 [Verrucomicrobiales bacterium]|nr:hypothetical protein [Verrucomicrobiales bacterium]|tara:strand:+ start:1199 stop:1615 length:417 start_codon:yes stop_codon:yes gene_type:complete